MKIIVKQTPKPKITVKDFSTCPVKTGINGGTP
jgi:hypothetical protein